MGLKTSWTRGEWEWEERFRLDSDSSLYDGLD